MGLDFEVIPAEVVEHEAPDSDPREMVRHNSALKAEWVAAPPPGRRWSSAPTRRFSSTPPCSTSRATWPMPGDAESAVRADATVYTGIAVRRACAGLAIDAGVASEVTFKRLTRETIDRYFALVNPLDKAGAYAIQEGTELIVEGWRGSYTNIVGLPVEENETNLTRCGLYGELRENH